MVKLSSFEAWLLSGDISTCIGSAGFYKKQKGYSCRVKVSESTACIICIIFHDH